MEKQEAQGDKKTKDVSYKTVLAIVGVAVLVVIMFLIYSVTKVDEPKVSFLDGREYNKQEMVTLVEGYITTVDKASWENRVSTTRFSKEVINQIYGKDYTEFILPEVAAYKFTDVQYTINETSNYKMYLSVIVEIGGVKQVKVFLASVEEDKIVHIEVY